MKTLFISDLHIGHENAIRFDNRPFKTIEEMDQELVRRWNQKVSRDDFVYVLGDFVWKSRNDSVVDILESLSGHIILIKGNHDAPIVNNRKARKRFIAVKDYEDISVTLQDGTPRRVIMSHYFIPMYNAHRYGAIHLHGHSHNSAESIEEFEIAKTLNEKGYKNEIYNVGCMHWNYEPVTLDEILAKGAR